MTSSTTPQPSLQQTSQRKRQLAKLLVVILIVGLLGYVYSQHASKLSPHYLAEQQDVLERFRLRQPVLVLVAAFGAYVVVAALSLPIAVPLTLLYGWSFPLWQSIPLVSFASTSGATLSFLISRYLLRDSLQARFADRLAGINDALSREGAFYLFSLRLISVIPFWMINLLMGLTPIRARTFYWVSQLGMLPGTLVYVYAGSQLPNLKALGERKLSSFLSPSLLAAFAALALFPLIVRYFMKRMAHAKSL